MAGCKPPRSKSVEHRLAGQRPTILAAVDSVPAGTRYRRVVTQFVVVDQGFRAQRQRRLVVRPSVLNRADQIRQIRRAAIGKRRGTISSDDALTPFEKS